ncbi:hypothetical protein EIK77_010177 [Talaromyces pinophilus]|nr:hypothetical protein EIK77_010177 [Talaromyces pinophilus]
MNTSDFCYKIPNSMTLEEAAMVEPVSVIVAITKTADLRANQTVLVLGCGPISVLCKAVAKAYSAKTVIGVDVVQPQLDVAKSYGTDHMFFPPRAEPSIDPIEHAQKVAVQINKELSLGDGADVVLKCSRAEPCVQLSIYAAKHGATFVQAGMGKENINFPITAVCIQGLVIKRSIHYLEDYYPAAINLISKGKIDIKRLITNQFKFKQAKEAFELVKIGQQDVFKVMISSVGY